MKCIKVKNTTITLGNSNEIEDVFARRGYPHYGHRRMVLNKPGIVNCAYKKGTDVDYYFNSDANKHEIYTAVEHLLKGLLISSTTASEEMGNIYHKTKDLLAELGLR